jgi:hypothetical protein
LKRRSLLMMGAASLAMAPFALPNDAHFLASHTLTNEGFMLPMGNRSFWSSSMGVWVPLLDFPHALFPAQGSE